MRGQVTAFIIIALLLALAVGILVYTDVLQVRLAREKITYPAGVQPVANFVTQCIADATKRGVQLLGQQGGYITLPASVQNEPKKYLAIDKLNVRKIPFWYTQGVLRIPTEAFMQNQLNAYVSVDVEQCLHQFTDFIAQYDITPQAPMSVTSTFTNEDVFVDVRYPLKIVQKQSGVAYDIDAFNTAVPVRVHAAYELARHIMEYSFDALPLENLTLDLMAMDTAIPMDGLLFSCGEKQWYTPKLKERVQYVLQQNVPNIRIKNTNYRPFLAPESTYLQLQQARKAMINEMIEAKDTIDIETTRAYPKNTPEDAFEYSNMFYDVGASNDGLQTAFTYDPSFGMNFQASPERNGLLRSSDANGPKLLKFICMQQYHFTYDVEYPVKVSVRDPSAFDNEGYLFDIAFTVTIDDNEPRPSRTTMNPLEDVAFDEEFCRHGGERTYDFRALGFDTEGYSSDTGLPDANITYLCISKMCPLGTTAARGGVYRLLTRLPSGCDNPFIRAEKDGYLPATKQLSTERDKALSLDLIKLKKMHVEVVRHEYYADVGGALHEAEPLGDEENVTVYWRIKDHDHDQFVLAPSKDAYVDVIDGDGTYEVDAMMSRRDVLLGGYRNNNLVLKYNDIAGKDTIQLHVFEYKPIPLEEAQQQDLMLYLIGESYNPTLLPTFT